MTHKPVNILVVAESLDVNASSGAKANLAFIRSIEKAGFNLLVYHYTRKEVSLKNISLVSINENRKSLLFFLSRLERYIRSYMKIYLNKPLERKFGFSFTLFNDRNSIVSALKDEKDFDPDWVLTLSQGGSFRPHHALLKIPKLHHKWIAYIHDPYPMHWYPKPYTWTEPGYKAKQRFMEMIADKCRYTAFPSLLLKELMGQHYRPYSEKGIVIPHQITSKNNSKKPSGIKLSAGEFVLLHAGNFLQARNPKGLIEGFKRFLYNNPEANVKFIHVGPAPHFSKYLEEEAEKFEQIEVYCENYSFDEVSYLQNNSSVNIIMEANAEFSPFLPGKFPHCIKAEKPILLLGPPKSEARRLLGNDYPYWSKIDEEKKIAKLLETLYGKWKGSPENFKLLRTDLQDYLSENYLKEVIRNITL